MSSLFINNIASVSPQPEDFLDRGKILEYQKPLLPAVNVNYKALIPPMILRRMSSAVKMGLYCAKKVSSEAGIDNPDGIIVGTGQGCLQDTEKFMRNILENEEKLLSPTSFIQSTHNTVAGQIALNLGCKAYNMTYTQNSGSFESALIDAVLQGHEAEIQNILVGGVDEISEVLSNFQQLDGQLKNEPLKNLDLLTSDSPGTIFSETASFFILGKTAAENSFARLKDVQLFNSPETHELEDKISVFLKRNTLSETDLDAVILGKNGDSEADRQYELLQRGIFKDVLQIGYKHLVGDNHSASAYAMWLACLLFTKRQIPDLLKLNNKEFSKPKNILLYNQYLGKNHGLILLQSA